jgi:predicted nucleic acid-binding protein
LLDFLRVIPVDVAVIKKSLLSNHKDFEDAIQIFASHAEKDIDVIVTRNVKDFKNAEIAVLPPDELLLHVQQ